MQEGREEPYTAPKVSSRPSRTLPTFFLFPSTVRWGENVGKLNGIFYSILM